LCNTCASELPIAAHDNASDNATTSPRIRSHSEGRVNIEESGRDETLRVADRHSKKSRRVARAPADEPSSKLGFV